MYIYLIKYYDEIIAAAENDNKADQVIRQYIKNNKDMSMKNFIKEPIRYFAEDKNDTKSKEDE